MVPAACTSGAEDAAKGLPGNAPAESRGTYRARQPPYGRIVALRRTGEPFATFDLERCDCPLAVPSGIAGPCACGANPSYVFGSDADADVRIELATLAPRHCRVDNVPTAGDRNAAALTAIASYGTVVNGAPLAAGSSVRLRDGDVFTVVERSFRFEDVAAHPYSMFDPRTARLGGVAHVQSFVSETPSAIPETYTPVDHGCAVASEEAVPQKGKLSIALPEMTPAGYATPQKSAAVVDLPISMAADLAAGAGLVPPPTLSTGDIAVGGTALVPSSAAVAGGESAASHALACTEAAGTPVKQTLPIVAKCDQPSTPIVHVSTPLAACHTPQKQIETPAAALPPTPALAAISAHFATPLAPRRASGSLPATPHSPSVRLDGEISASPRVSVLSPARALACSTISESTAPVDQSDAPALPPAGAQCGAVTLATGCGSYVLPDGGGGVDSTTLAGHVDAAAFDCHLEPFGSVAREHCVEACAAAPENHHGVSEAQTETHFEVSEAQTETHFEVSEAQTDSHLEMSEEQTQCDANIAKMESIERQSVIADGDKGAAEQTGAMASTAEETKTASPVVTHPDDEPYAPLPGGADKGRGDRQVTPRSARSNASRRSPASSATKRRAARSRSPTPRAAAPEPSEEPFDEEDLADEDDSLDATHAPRVAAGHKAMATRIAHAREAEGLPAEGPIPESLHVQLVEAGHKGAEARWGSSGEEGVSSGVSEETHEKLSTAGHKGADSRWGSANDHAVSEETRERLSAAEHKGAEARWGGPSESHPSEAEADGAKSLSTHEKRVEAGRKGAAARWGTGHDVLGNAPQPNMPSRRASMGSAVGGSKRAAADVPLGGEERRRSLRPVRRASMGPRP